MRSSTITATYNRAEQLKRGMLSIIHQGQPPDEIVIVDDGSTDNTRDVCLELASLCQLPDRSGKKIDLKYFYLNHPEPRISCIAHNVGIKQATGDLLIFTESECLHSSDSIKKLTTHLIEHPNEVPLASQVWSCGDKFYKEIICKTDWGMEQLMQNPYADFTSAEHPNNDKAPDSDWGMSGQNHCFVGQLFGCYKKDALAIGGYDESMKAYAYEDWSFIHRLNNYGKQFIFRDDIPNLHMWHDKSYLTPAAYETGKTNADIFKDQIDNHIVQVNVGRDWGVID